MRTRFGVGEEGKTTNLDSMGDIKETYTERIIAKVVLFYLNNKH